MGGCGTGNYMQTMLQRGIASKCQWTGLEHSSGMRAKFLDKCRGHDSITCNVGSLLEPLPFDDESQDVIICTQVVHHLVQDGSFSAVSRLLKEVHRVLRPGGVFWLQTQTPEQHRHGFWWGDLFPRAQDRLASQFQTLEEIKKDLQSAGFANVSTRVPSDTLMKHDTYNDITGPFRQSFRNGDSGFSLATPKELQAGLDRLGAILDEGRAEEWMNEQEKKRRRIGRTTTVVATRASSCSARVGTAALSSEFPWMAFGPLLGHREVGSSLAGFATMTKSASGRSTVVDLDHPDDTSTGQ